MLTSQLNAMISAGNALRNEEGEITAKNALQFTASLATQLAGMAKLILANGSLALIEQLKKPFPANIPAMLTTAGMLASVSATVAGCFENGGIVGGSSYYGDNIVARVNSGEMILNRSQQGNLFDMINSGTASGGSSGGNVNFEIKGDKLVGLLANYNSKHKRFR